ncbi:MAG TPA: hypothetical protein VHC95_11785, partial [Opitutales bacterium]|nr:hypothetical protein [Opitutales bacterium]
MIPADPSEPKFTRSYPPPRPPSSFPWGQVAAMVLFFGVAGWAWYHFEWQRRLPQEHTFTDSQGKSIEARIEGRAGDVIKYTRLADNTIHFVPIASLAAADQDFANRFSSNLELSYPLECFMGDKDHPAAAIRIEGRNDDWVRYTSLADRIVHYEPLLSFSNDDQTVLKLLSRHLPVDVPLDKAFHDTSGQRLGDRVEGRSRELVQLSSPGQPALYYPIHDLAPLDKNLASLLPYSFELRFPYECILTDKNGKKLNVRMEGRSASMVKYTLLADGQAYYAPMTDFSLVDCEVFRALPSDLSFAPPLNYNLVDAQGRVIPATIEGRTDKLVQYTSSDSGRIYFSAIKGFSSDTQNFLNLVPSTLRVNYPLEATLTSAAGQELQA